MPESKRYILLITLLTGMGLLSNFAMAKMYKWTDEDGNVHYTQQPPPGDVESTVVKPPPPVDTEKAQDELKQQQDKLENLEEEKQKQQEEAAKSGEKNALYEKNCRISQARLKSLQNTGRVRAVDENGNITRLTTEEHNARIDEVKEKIKKYCK